MKLCINCVHCWVTYCNRRVTYELSGPNPVTGVSEKKRLGASISCYTERSLNGGCGVEARYYVPKRWLERLIIKIKQLQE